MRFISAIVFRTLISPAIVSPAKKIAAKAIADAPRKPIGICGNEAGSWEAVITVDVGVDSIDAGEDSIAASSWV